MYKLPNKIIIALFTLTILTVFIPTFWFQTDAATGINKTINFQGKVVNTNGTNVADGTYDFVIKIYDGPGSAGSTLFTESWTSAALFTSTTTSTPPTAGTDGTFTYGTATNDTTLKVGQILTNTTKGESVYITSINTGTKTIGISATRQTWASGDSITNKIYVKDGIFRVVINSLNQDLSGVNFNSNSIYFGVNFNGDGEMKPRVQFSATPYAFNADQMNGLTVANSSGNLSIAPIAAGTVSLSTFGNGNGLTLTTADGASGNSGGLTIATGNAASNTSGSIGIDVGGTASTKGTISIGNTNASALTVGNSGALLTLNGSGVNVGTSTNSKTIQLGATATATDTVNFLRAGVGTIKFANFNVANQLLYVSATDGTLSALAPNASTTMCLTQASSGTPAWGSCGAGGGSSALSDLTAGTTPHTIDSTNNAQTWNWSTLTTQTGLTLGGGSAMTTGSVLGLGSGTYVHTTAQSGSLATLSFTDASTNTSGATTTNGLNIASTLNTSGAGTKSVNGINVAAPTLTGCATGNCTWSGETVNTQSTGTASTITQNGLNVAAAGVSAGTLNGINVSNITAGSGTETGINIGNNWDTGLAIGTSSTYAINTAQGEVNLADNSNTNPSLQETNNTISTLGAGINTTGMVNFQSTSLTTGNLLNLQNTTTQTTGTLLNVSSASNALAGNAVTDHGLLGNYEWNPTSPSTVTGDLFRIAVNANAAISGNIFDIVSNSSSLFSISPQQVTTSVPFSETASGDLSAAYDLNFTNPTASFIKSSAPLTIQAGEVFGSSNLTLATFNQGSVVLSTSNTTSTAFDLTNSTLTSGVGINATLSALNTGVGEQIVASALTTGQALSITAGGATALTSGSGLLVTGPTGAAAISNTSGLVKIISSGAVTGTAGSGTLLDVIGNGTITGTLSSISDSSVMTGAGELLSLTAGAATTTTNGLFNINAAGLTSGSAAIINVNGTNPLTSGQAIQVVGPTGAAAISNNSGLVKISSSGAVTGTAGSGTLLDLIGNGTITGTLASVSDSSIMTGAGELLSLTANAATTTTNGLFNVSGTGVTTGHVALLSGNTSATLTTGDTLNVIGGKVSFTPTRTQASGAAITWDGVTVPATTATLTGAVTVATTNGYNLFSINAPTITDSSAATVTNSSTLFISGAPIAGGSAILTNKYALFTGGGKVQFTCTTNNLNAATNPNCSDYAEEYDLAGAAEAGDILMVDSQNSSKVTKASGTYQNQIAGVYSTSPGMLIGPDGIISAGGSDINLPAGKAPVALSGRVPAKVSTENGPIKSGDFLTTSSISGVAMKATKPGEVLGKALEDYDKTGVDKIMVFVNVGFADPENILLNVAVGQNGLLTSTSQNIAQSDLPQIGQTASLDTAKLSGAVTVEQFQDLASRVKNLEDQILMKQLSPDLESTPSANMATSSATINRNSNDISNILSFMSNDSTQSGVFDPSEGTASGNLNLFNLNIGSQITTNELHVKDVSIFDGMVQILESLTTRSLLVTDIANFLSDVVFKSNVSFEGRPTFNSDTAGFAIIQKNAQEVQVKFAQEYDQEPVVNASVTLDDNLTDEERALLDPQDLQQKMADQEASEEALLNSSVKYIITKRSTTGFSIRLNAPAPMDVKFSWNAISVKDANTAIATPLPSSASSPVATSVVNNLVLSAATSSSRLIATTSSTIAPTPIPQPVKQLTVNKNPLGYLRVRINPDATSGELGQVNPGQTFEVISESKSTSSSSTIWYQIALHPGDLGWVSGNYVTIN